MLLKVRKRSIKFLQEWYLTLVFLLINYWITFESDDTHQMCSGIAKMDDDGKSWLCDLEHDHLSKINKKTENKAKERRTFHHGYIAGNFFNFPSLDLCTESGLEISCDLETIYCPTIGRSLNEMLNAINLCCRCLFHLLPTTLRTKSTVYNYYNILHWLLIYPFQHTDSGIVWNFFFLTNLLTDKSDN